MLIDFLFFFFFLSLISQLSIPFSATSHCCHSTTYPLLHSTLLDPTLGPTFFYSFFWKQHKNKQTINIPFFFLLHCTTHSKDNKKTTTNHIYTYSAIQNGKMAIFAPLILPVERRLQTGAVLVWIAALGTSFTVFFYLCTIRYLWPFIIIYLLWILMVDQAPEHGGRRSLLWRNWIGWTYFARYFPMTLIKVCNIVCLIPLIDRCTEIITNTQTNGQAHRLCSLSDHKLLLLERPQKLTIDIHTFHWWR